MKWLNDCICYLPPWILQWLLILCFFRSLAQSIKSYYNFVSPNKAAFYLMRTWLLTEHDRNRCSVPVILITFYFFVVFIFLFFFFCCWMRDVWRQWWRKFLKYRVHFCRKFPADDKPAEVINTDLCERKTIDKLKTFNAIKHNWDRPLGTEGITRNRIRVKRPISVRGSISHLKRSWCAENFLMNSEHAVNFPNYCLHLINFIFTFSPISFFFFF